MKTEFVCAIDRVVEEILSDLNRTHPPVDAMEALRRLGVHVAIDASQATRGRQKTLAGQKAVLLKPDPRPERIQWAAAHELGEVNAWRIVSQIELVDDEISAHWREQIANLFASRFLLPECWFPQRARQLDNNLFDLKREFATASHELVARRLLDVPPHKILTVIDRERVTSRTGPDGGSVPGLCEAEKACWREAAAASEPRTSRSEEMAIDVWPIHEPGWKREILLTTFLGEEDFE